MTYKKRLKDINALIFDVDGVLTDGSIILQPDGSMSRIMSVLDGFAFAKAVKAGLKIGIITGGNDEMVRKRMEYLGVKDVYLGAVNKLDDYAHFLEKYQLDESRILYMGDDIPDLEVMKRVGISTCPANAVPEIKEIADYISGTEGGKGAARDVIRQVMLAQDTWPGDGTLSR